MKGSYCLLIRCRKKQLIEIGKLGRIGFREGFYLYVGSALGGIEKRVLRHLGHRNKNFWHIDYFLSNPFVSIDYVYCIVVDRKVECDIAKIMNTIVTPVSGFGSSDCRCKSHLFFINPEMGDLQGKTGAVQQLDSMEG
jgi:Uri superfamily endonuclease